ncbi:MAG: WD40 repeat domain-containing protein [Methanoregula sp.]
MKIPVSAPLIGPWLYRRSVKEIAERAQQGDGAAVRSLAGMFCTCRDESVRTIARTALCSLDSVPAIDTLCTEALERDDAALYSIATGRNYLPSDPGTQALFLFVTGQQERYARMDNQPHRPLLASAYTQATNRVRFHTRSEAKKSGQLPVLAAALRGAGQNGNATAWPEEDWKIVFDDLIQEREWKELWPLVVQAPVHRAIAAITAMNAAGWRPDGDDRALWDDITSTVPKEWASPVPEDATPALVRSPDSQPLRLVFSGDGTLFAAGCADGTVCLWNTKTGTPVFRLLSGLGTISGIAISPDNSRLLCAGTDGTLQCRDTGAGTLLWSVASGKRTPVQFACSHDGIFVILISARGNMRIVNMADGQVQALSGGHEAAVTCCTLSPHDWFCAVGYADGAVGCWDLQGKKYLPTLEGLGDPVSSLTFCKSDEEILVIYNQNRPVRWHRGSGVRTRTYTGNTGPLICCSLTQDGSSFAIAGDDHMLRFWQAGNADPVSEIPLYKRPLASCAVSSDGMKFAAGCTDGTFRVYAMNGGTVLSGKKAHKQAITSIVLSSPANQIATAGGDGTMKLWNTTTGELVRTLLRPAGGVTTITATPDGSIIFAGYEEGTARQISCEAGALNRMLDMYTTTIRAIALNPDGTLLACAGGDTTLRVWNNVTGGLVTGIEGLTTSQHCLAFSPDGTMLISGGWDGKVRLWSMPGGSLVKTLTGHTSNITALAITPDNTLLATGSNDRSVRLWTLGNGACISVREESRSEVSALAMSPDGALLAFASADAVIHLCHLPDGRPAPAIPALPGKITALAFADNGRVLVAGLDSGTVAFFSCTGRHLLRSIPAHTAAVTGIAVLPGEESVLTSSLDGLMRRLNLPWTRPLFTTTLEDIPLVARHKRTCSQTEAQAQWAFLHDMLAARFASDIELCTAVDDERMYDIQIVG